MRDETVARNYAEALFDIAGREGQLEAYGEAMESVARILAEWRQEFPNLAVAPMGVVGRVRRLSTFFLRGMEETWAKFGLNVAGFDVLSTLLRAGAPYSLSPGDLIASTMVTSGTMTNRIDQLEKAGLVDRIRNPEDGRGSFISLTEKGFDVIDKAVTEHVATQHRLVSGLSQTQQKDLNRLLKSFLADLEN